MADAVKAGTIRKEEVIMLNITGGGEELAKSENDIVYAKPDLVLDPSLPAETIIAEVNKLY